MVVGKVLVYEEERKKIKWKVDSTSSRTAAALPRLNNAKPLAFGLVGLD
jgi:hypothetical protein